MFANPSFAHARLDPHEVLGLGSGAGTVRAVITGPCQPRDRGHAWSRWPDGTCPAHHTNYTCGSDDTGHHIAGGDGAADVVVFVARTVEHLHQSADRQRGLALSDHFRRHVRLGLRILPKGLDPDREKGGLSPTAVFLVCLLFVATVVASQS